MADIHQVTLTLANKSFECSESDSILKGGLRHGLALRYECSNGTCGACKAKLVTGNIEQVKHHDFSLSDDELASKVFLMCCQAPSSDLELEVDLIGDVRTIPLQEIQIKVKDIRFVSDDMAIVSVRTPRSKTLQFMAGQDVELCYKGILARYPIASCPCYGMELEFHIRKLASDDFSQAIFSKSIKSKSKIDLTGPKGVFVLKETSNKPMVFIAWDSGFAPIRSLIEHAFSLEMSNPVYFYWAYPVTESMPYLDNHAKSWQVVMDEYHYQSIACEFDRSSKNDCHKVAQQIYDSLDHKVVNQSELYISAPAEVLIYLGELLLENGLDEAQLIASPI
ncbi:MAG: 2Fe-2S iron-sulfur cluster binding domain-containing protein [Candidatus Thioglobus sp.]|nr:2Fe-2S iron-sulfur cluster binding domain-containing protein [Candidatus Thioglobus pontius]MBL6976513.1 2Fe-2S iron-sulfur cluster binding domain-containing protein [Candidatus Thioglobus sp.]MBL6984000.1 2Fe-2S iron-sulfur cluster binding domain-containing protein [Candidatus Thioglobus sp.]